MNPAFSAYLDLVRLLSALIVFLGHANGHLGMNLSIGVYKHQAVIVFFVLSGYVIAYTRSEKEKEPVLFAIKRLSRLHSVAIPAMVLTVVLDFAGRHINPSEYLGTPFDHFFIRFFAPLTFTNEIGPVSIMSFSNWPFWSLSYEFWYYVLFGVFCFARGRPRIIALPVLAVLIGPKILLLFPVWLTGVFLYTSRIGERLPAVLGWALFAGSLFLFFAFYQSAVPSMLTAITRQFLSDAFMRNLANSKWFPTDYVCGLLIAANFLGMKVIARSISKLPRPVLAGIRWASSFTLSLYLFHTPLLLFFNAIMPGAMMPGGPASALRTASILLACLGTTVALGYVTERNRKGFERRIVTPAVAFVLRIARAARGAKRSSAPGVT